MIVAYHCNSLWRRERRKHRGMYRREALKLAIEVHRGRYHKRQHLPVKFVLEDRRWRIKSDARLRQKRYRQV